MTPEERAELVADIALALQVSHIVPVISDEELQWVLGLSIFQAMLQPHLPPQVSVPQTGLFPSLVQP